MSSIFDLGNAPSANADAHKTFLKSEGNAEFAEKS